MASPRRHAVKVEDSMRLGYFAMPLHPPGADPATTMDGDLAQLATLDRLGYEEPASPTAATWRIARDVYVADTVARKLAKLSGDVGGFGTLLVIAHEWTPRGAWERSMRLLKDKVVPRLGRRSR